MCLNILEMYNNREANVKMTRGFIMSTNMLMTDPEKVKQLVQELYKGFDSIIAMDTEVGGVAVACQFFDVPIVCLKSVTYEVGNREQFIIRERVGVEMTPIIGNLIGNLFVELASQEQLG